MKNSTFTVIPQNMVEYQMSIREADFENDIFRIAAEAACKEYGLKGWDNQHVMGCDLFKEGWEAAVRLLNDDAEQATNAAPVAWTYEQQQRGPNSHLWTPFMSSRPPEAAPNIRNVRPLFYGPAAASNTATAAPQINPIAETLIRAGHTESEAVHMAAESRARLAATAAPGDLPIICYVKTVTRGWPEYNKVDEFSDGESGGDALVKLADVEKLIANNARSTTPCNLPPEPKQLFYWNGFTMVTIDAMREYGRACIASNAGAAPGFKFLSREPVEAMIHAAEDLPAPRMFGTVWRAMWDAAPSNSGAKE